MVAAEDRDSFRSFLDDHDFEQVDSHEKSWFYDTEVVEFEKRLAPTQPIGFDLLVNGLGCRQTGAQWSFEYLREHSRTREISGGTSSTVARAVEGPLLVAAKIHSGRETDFRDVVAIAPEIDLDAVTPHLHRGDDDELCQQLHRGVEILDSDDLRHGFRSEFGASSVSTETIERVQKYLNTQIHQLESNSQ